MGPEERVAKQCGLITLRWLLLPEPLGGSTLVPWSQPGPLLRQTSIFPASPECVPHLSKESFLGQMAVTGSLALGVS